MGNVGVLKLFKKPKKGQNWQNKMSRNKLIWKCSLLFLCFVSCVVFQDFNLLGFDDDDRPFK